MAEHDEIVESMMVANRKLAESVDDHLDSFRKELYNSIGQAKSSEEIRESRLKELMRRFDNFVGQQIARMQKFVVGSTALSREIEARVSVSRPASEPTKNPQFFDMARDDGLQSHVHPLREHVHDVADLRDVANDQGGPLFAGSC